MTSVLRIINSNPIHQSIFLQKKNPYEGSYAGPNEGSNADPNEMPNDDLNKNCDIIALMIKSCQGVDLILFLGKKLN